MQPSTHAFSVSAILDPHWSPMCTCPKAFALASVLAPDVHMSPSLLQSGPQQLLLLTLPGSSCGMSHHPISHSLPCSSFFSVYTNTVCFTDHHHLPSELPTTTLPSTAVNFLSEVLPALCLWSMKGKWRKMAQRRTKGPGSGTKALVS